MTEFTPMSSMMGGLLLGLSTIIFLASTGRIAGLSGITNRLLSPGNLTGDKLTGLIFLVGIVFSVTLYGLFSDDPPEVMVTVDTPLLVISGVLVGFGAIIGSGCTSGHGICGLSRLSMRSVIATISFMSAAFVTVYIIRHVLGS